MPVLLILTVGVAGPAKLFCQPDMLIRKLYRSYSGEISRKDAKKRSDAKDVRERETERRARVIPALALFLALLQIALSFSSKLILICIMCSWKPAFLYALIAASFLQKTSRHTSWMPRCLASSL